MGKESVSRFRFHEQRRRQELRDRDWQRGRRDSQGREYYQDGRRRDESRGRSGFKSGYREESRGPRDFSRGRRSQSRGFRRESEGRSDSRGSYKRESTGRGGTGGEYRREEYRSKSREKGKEKCTACKCDDCKKRKEIVDELSVNWCKMEDRNV